MKQLLLSLVALTGVAHADVPLSRAASGHLTAPVRIGTGAEAPFVVDTGAEGCALYEGFARERGLLSLGSETVSGQTGAASVPLVKAPSMTLDGMRVGALGCVVLPARPDGVPLAGIVGADVLARFVVVYDLRRMTLSLHGGAQHGQALVSPRARLVDARRLDGGLLAVPVRLNSARGVAVIDTGARRSVFNTRFAEAAGVASLGPAEMLHGAAAIPQQLQGGKLGAFELAGRTTPQIEGRVADLEVFETFGLAHSPAMILGLDRLGGQRLVIDYPRNRIWFDPG
jgi:predicted aspartyl protease